MTPNVLLTGKQPVSGCATALLIVRASSANVANHIVAY